MMMSRSEPGRDTVFNFLFWLKATVSTIHPVLASPLIVFLPLSF